MKPKNPAPPPTEPAAYSPPSAPATSTALSTAPTYAALPSPTIFLYRAPLQQFLTDCAAGTLAATLRTRFLEIEGRLPGDTEIRAWDTSLPALAAVLRDDRLAHSHILVELRMPLSGRRCDALLTGRDTTGHATAVVVELKAWTQVKKSAVPEDVAIGTSSRQHPSAQVRDYVQFLSHYHSALTEHGGVRATGCVYLHDLAHLASVQHLRDPAVFGTLPIDYPLFTRGESAALAQWLAGHLAGGDGAPIADAIANGRARPSEKLLDVLVDAVQGNFEWKLLDQQRRAYMIIVSAVEAAKATGKKTVVLVRGGPGTGKSVLAIQLLAHAARKHWRVIHATGSQAFQTNLQAKTTHFALEMMKKVYNANTKKALPVAEMFCTFSNVAAMKEPDVFDLVVADEAHRLWKHRMQTKGPGLWVAVSDTPMVEEMIRASRVTAFFLDDHQGVRSGEIGHSSLIRAHAFDYSRR